MTFAFVRTGTNHIYSHASTYAIYVAPNEVDLTAGCTLAFCMDGGQGLSGGDDIFGSFKLPWVRHVDGKGMSSD